MSKIEKLPLWKIVMYSAGNFGWILASFASMNTLIYFYMPPDTGTVIFPSYVFPGKILGIVTIIGLSAAWGRILCAVVEPWIANLSDRTSSKLGRRRLFMAISLVPYTLFSCLMFFPLTPHQSTANAVWLIICVTIAFFFISMYGNPLYTLISELGHSPAERVNLTTGMSIAGLFGTAAGSQIYMLKDFFSTQYHLNGSAAFQATVAVFGVLSLITMLLPVIFIDEKRYCESHVTNERLIPAMKSVLKSRAFLMFTLGNAIYCLVFTIVLDGLNYFVMILLRLPENIISKLMIVLVVVTLLLYVPLNFASRRLGKKKLVLFAFTLLMFNLAYISVCGKVPLDPVINAYIIAVAIAIPLAVFGLLTSAIIADIAESEGIKSGNYREALFFGTNGFIGRLGAALGNLILPSFLLLGKSFENPTGIITAAVSAAAVCILGIFVYSRYDEKAVFEILKQKEHIDIEEEK